MLILTYAKLEGDSSISYSKYNLTYRIVEENYKTRIIRLEHKFVPRVSWL